MDSRHSFSSLKKGFTLVEVLIVILIIALLMAFIIPQVLRGPAAARDATRISHVGTLAVALESYRSAKREYPAPGNGCMNATSGAGKELVEGGFITADRFPEDPDKNNTSGSCQGEYLYVRTPVNGIQNAGFVVFSKLETPGRANASQSDLNPGDLSNHTFGKGGGNLEYYYQSSGQ